MGAGAVILAEETLTLTAIDEWAGLISGQPSWSDLPIILLTVSGEVDRESQRKMRVREPMGNVVLLERPVRPETLISTVQADLRSRRRQYQMRDYLAERGRVEDALRRSEKLAVAGRLAASISHEINNPLASITNLLFLIGSSSSLEESKQSHCDRSERIKACLRNRHPYSQVLPGTDKSGDRTDPRNRRLRP